MSLDPGAFSSFYTANAPGVYRAALGIVRDPALAEDVVQETFVRAYTATDDIVSPAAWLGTVARRLALNELRRLGRWTALAEDAADDEGPSGTQLLDETVWADPAKTATSADSVATAAACLDVLRPDDRTLLTLRYAEDQDIETIAGLLGKTVNATTVALHRARARFDAVYTDRVFARPGLPEACRSFHTDAVAHAAGKPASDAYLTHLATCSWCSESEADLRTRATAFAFAPFLGLPLGLPLAAKSATLALLAGHGVAVGASAAVGSAATSAAAASGGVAASGGAAAGTAATVASAAGSAATTAAAATGAATAASGSTGVGFGTVLAAAKVGLALAIGAAAVAGTVLAVQSGASPRDDQLSGPASVATDGKFVYVADGSRDRIARFRLDGLTFVDSFASSGSGVGQLAGPRGIAYDSGYLYVIDSGNHRVVRISAASFDGTGWAAFGGGPADWGPAESPGSIAVAGGAVYVTIRGPGDEPTSSYIGYVAKFDAGPFDGTGWVTYSGRPPRAPDATPVPALEWRAAANPPYFQELAGIAVSGGAVYVGDNFRLVSLSTALDGSGWMTFGGFGNLGNNYLFHDVADLAIDRGRLIVSSARGLISVEVPFATDSAVGSTGPTDLGRAGGIAFAGSQAVVTDSTGRLATLDLGLTHAIASTGGGVGTAPDQIQTPWAVGSDGQSLLILEGQAAWSHNGTRSTLRVARLSLDDLRILASTPVGGETEFGGYPAMAIDGDVAVVYDSSAPKFVAAAVRTSDLSPVPVPAGWPVPSVVDPMSIYRGPGPTPGVYNGCDRLTFGVMTTLDIPPQQPGMESPAGYCFPVAVDVLRIAPFPGGPWRLVRIEPITGRWIAVSRLFGDEPSLLARSADSLYTTVPGQVWILDASTLTASCTLPLDDGMFPTSRWDLNPGNEPVVGTFAAGALYVASGPTHTIVKMSVPGSGGQCPAGAPSETPVPVPTPGLSAFPSPSIAPSVSPSRTLSPLSSATPSASSSPTPSPSPLASPTPSRSPSPNPAPSRLGTAVAIAVGQNHSCAIVAGSSVACWGADDSGQLGDGTKTNSSVPVAVTGVSGATAIAAGGTFTCVIVAGGTVWCWGSSGFGALGGSTWATQAAPVAVAGVTGATAIAAGSDHVCVVLSDGSVACWGFDAFGQVGDGKTSLKSLPVRVSGISDAIAVAAGTDYSCALLRGGSVWCWGANGFGQLGDGTTTQRLVPVAVPGITGAVAIAAGFYHTCSVLGDGTATCWGWDGYGFLDHGTTNSLTPAAVAGVAGATAITAGTNHTCALLRSGSVDCWGRDDSGQLGDGAKRDVSASVRTPRVTGVTAISAGSLHTCAVLSDGSVRCWGSN